MLGQVDYGFKGDYVEFVEKEQVENHIAKYGNILKDIERQKEQEQLYQSYLKKTKKLDTEIDYYIYDIRSYRTFIKEQANLLKNF